MTEQSEFRTLGEIVEHLVACHKGSAADWLLAKGEWSEREPELVAAVEGYHGPNGNIGCRCWRR